MIEDLLVRPALELARLLRAGQIHALELVEGALRRLEEREPRINAFCFVDAELALAEAPLCKLLQEDDPPSD